MTSIGPDEGRGRSFRKLSRSWYLGCCLLDAMRYGRWEDVYALTKIRELDPNILLPEYGITPMHCAAGIEPEEFGLKCIRQLLHIGGNPNVRCCEGVTPVHVASCWSRMKVLKSLLKRGGDPYLLDDDGNDAFYYSPDSEKIKQFIVELENKKSKENQCELMCNKLNNSIASNTTEIKNYLAEDSEDLNLNTEAYALMMRHRKSVFIFESFPEDDAASSTTLESEVIEDFAYDPKDGMESVFVGEKKKIVDFGPCETWTNNSDDEILNENILDADKTHVIQVINDNVNKSISGGSGNTGLKIVKDSENFEPSHSPWYHSKDYESHHYDLANTASKETNCSIKSNKLSPNNDESIIYDLKTDQIQENFSIEDNDNARQDLLHDNLQPSFEFDTNNNETVCHQDNSEQLEETRKTPANGSSSNILGLSFSPNMNKRNVSRDKINIWMKKKSESSSSSIKSVSQETNYSTPLESKEFEKFYKISNYEESVTSNKNVSKLPKNIRETLQNFRVNTHYKSRTRVYRMVSKSCDGFKTKKSLYCTAFEYWTSKVRSKSDPSPTSRRRISRSQVI